MKKKWLRPATALTIALGMILLLPLIPNAAEAGAAGKPGSLTVEPCGDPGPAEGDGAQDAGMKEDLATITLEIDLYKVAAMEKEDGYDSYTYELLDAYQTLAIDRDIDNDGWREQSQMAAAIALAGECMETPDPAGNQPVYRTGRAGEKIADLEPGLYLVIARAKDATGYVRTVTTDAGERNIVTTADTAEYTYTFLPELVTVPGKDPIDGVAGTATEYGPWKDDVTITLKPEREKRFGSLEILKTLLTYETSSDAVFVFLIEGTDDAGKLVYSDEVTLAFSAPGEKRVQIDNIPVGTHVTVTEVYTGASYELVTDREQHAVIEVDTLAHVEFTNDYDRRQNGGYGITNHFGYVESEIGGGAGGDSAGDGNTAGGSWSWSQLTDNETIPGTGEDPGSGSVSGSTNPDSGSVPDAGNDADQTNGTANE